MPLKVAVSIGRRRSGVSVRNNIVALWYLLHVSNPINDRAPKEVEYELRKFVARTMKKWNSRNSRGLSEFIQSELIMSILEVSDQIRFKRILTALDKHEKERERDF